MMRVDALYRRTGTEYRERAHAARYPQQVYAFELQLIGKQVTADCQLDRS